MANNPLISKIKIGSTTYDIKDAVARAAMSGGTHVIGSSSTAITDGGNQKPTINDNEIIPLNGDIVFYKASGSQVQEEFIFFGEWNETVSQSGKWSLLGHEGLGNLAYKNNASGSINTTAHKHTYKRSTLSHDVTNPKITSTGRFTPDGTISSSTTIPSGKNKNYTPTGSIQVNAASGSGTSYTPEGSVTVSPSTTSVTMFDSSIVTVHDTPTLNKSAIGSASNWSAGTLPSYTYTSASETLELTVGSLPSLTVTSTQVGTSLIEGTAKSVLDNSAHASGTIKLFTSESNVTSVVTGISSSAFTGTEKKLAFSGTDAYFGFSGTSNDVTVEGTPNISIADHTESDTNTSEVTVTGTVTVS